MKINKQINKIIVTPLFQSKRWNNNKLKLKKLKIKILNKKYWKINKNYCQTIVSVKKKAVWLSTLWQNKKYELNK